MSHMLEFLSHGPLPHNARKPPYVLFGINGKNVSSSLPPRIPLSIVLYFAPKLKEWILPSPAQLPRHAENLALRTPFVGINVQGDIDFQGLEWIIVKMMIISGAAQPKELFFVSPSLIVSVSIHRAWLALELPIAGLDGLYMHMQMQLTMIPAVTLAELQAIWHSFAPDSVFVQLAATNFIKSDIDSLYDPKDVAGARYWLSASTDRYRFFKSIEKRTLEHEVETWKAQGENSAVAVGKDRVVDRRKHCQRIKSNVSVTSVETLDSNLQAQREKENQSAMGVILTEALLKLKLERNAEEDQEENT